MNDSTTFMWMELGIHAYKTCMKQLKGCFASFLGFLPRGLYNACPQGLREFAQVGDYGQAAYNSKLMR